MVKNNSERSGINGECNENNLQINILTQTLYDTTKFPTRSSSDIEESFEDLRECTEAKKPRNLTLRKVFQKKQKF